ncbi:cold shock domain-containing protein [uncultured Williamsia sp.]|uniref:cold-shock protein n=1 Tax=uncultured Williamsia sp. TaxID=259311 RepID=UPI002601DBA4|nr:cold shock domain-containing protein [uncultured Williamsia sp.]
MRSTGTVRSWDFDEGQGIIDSPDIPAGLVASSWDVRCEAVTTDPASGMSALGLEIGEEVDVIWSPADTDEEAPHVIAVWPSRCPTPVLRTGAFSTALWTSATRDDGVTVMREVDPNSLPPVPPRPPLPRTTGVVRAWHPEEGWGVVESPETPGGAWVHFSEVRGDGYRSLIDGQRVEFDWEAAHQDGFSFRASDVEVIATPDAG